ETEKFIEGMLADKNVRKSFSDIAASQEFNDFLKDIFGNEDVQKSAANISKTDEFGGFVKVLGLKEILGIKK
ncbi:MAG TPA: hypothetical protein HA346_07580, partial [Thermoplasmata archaeon]|nr:hypothetical protein [Thermoplasmata archaeon]